MTNEDIIDKNTPLEMVVFEYKKTLELMELARADEREKWKPYLLDSVLTDAEFKEYTGSEREKMQGVDCNCLKCSPNVFPNLRFNVCPICGNKRCPHASDHNYKCTDSNEPGQSNQLTTEATNE